MALALAVIAFVAQIIMFIVQAAAANDQQEKAQEVYAQTMRALTLIEEKMEGTRQTVHTMSEKLLTRVLGGMPEPVAKEALALEIENSAHQASSSRLPQQRLAYPPSTGDGDLSGSSYELPYLPPTASREADPEIVRMMREFPTGADLESARSALADATVREGHYLSMLADDEIRSRQPGFKFGAGLSILPTSKELFQRGLVRQVRLPHNPNKTVFLLTKEGRNAARIFTARGRPPSGFPQDLLELIEKVADYQKEINDRINSPDPNVPVDDA
ncbi:hypothetical protein [Micromonospora sp. NPDC023888]|uniref:hypothetical protein n=1 Tax=Micromonospora sp. NPDC023888 TaxID=3155607 RepID=UPI0033CE3E1F